MEGFNLAALAAFLLAALLGVLGGIGIAGWLLARARSAPAAGADPTAAPAESPPNQASIAEPPAGTERPLAAIGAALESDYERSAHPADLASHPVFREGVARFATSAMPLDQVVNAAVGANKELAAMACAALAERTDSAPAVPRLLAHLRFAYVWTTYYALGFVDARGDAPLVGRVLLETPEWWIENPVMPQVLSAFIDQRVAHGEALDLGAAIDAHPRESLAEMEAMLGKLVTPHAGLLREQLAGWRRTRIDRVFLASIGRLVDPNAPADPIIEHEALRIGVRAGLDAILKSPARSFVVVGDTGVGKSVLIRALGRSLAESGWTVFEASAADVNAGMSYIGELEGRMRRLLEELEVRRRVVWYVPNIHELFYAGRHRLSPMGILDYIMPAVEAGRICVIGEAQPGALERVLRERPRVRGAFASIAIEPMLEADALALADAVVARELRANGIACEPAVAGEAVELARHYLGGRELPGSAIELLRQTKSRLVKAGAQSVSRDELFATLTELTGLPRAVLDDQAGLDTHALREHFASHVMGQPEAVACLVDRVAMLKAGLVDPGRPVGVFLFAGPTGTGKTEVAKTLATFLFGSPDRMIRLDMSEFQEPPSLARLVGEPGASEGGETHSLASRIRKQPFSVVLLDEFEKAHPRVWDLFLQVFDDGRLTDAQGALADFRHAIVILTSNLGATAHQGSSLGFTDSGSPFSAAQIERVISQTFRPEFVNRLDRVVVFHPLARSVMRDILKKELRNVLDRRGFRMREWAVEWEDSAIEFLLDRGFTRDMGARPLRRAIEAHVLAPLALTIVEHRHPEGDQFLFVRASNEAIEVEFVDPDAPEPAPNAPEPAAGDRRVTTAASLILNAAGTETERDELAGALARLTDRLRGAAWGDAKAALLERVNGAGFWDDPERFTTLDRIERIDRIEAGAQTAGGLYQRLADRAARKAPPARSVIASLAEQLYLLEAALADLDEGVGADVYLSIEPIAEEGAGGTAEAATAGQEWARTLAHMYRAWAAKRRMRVSLADSSERAPYLYAIAGFGAHRILASEAGLHVLEIPEDNLAHADSDRFLRRSARVRVVPQPVSPKPPQQAARDYAFFCLSAVNVDNTIVRRYRDGPSPLVRDAKNGWRSGRLDRVLGGDFDVIGA